MVRILYKIVQRIEERRDNLYFGKIGKKSKVVKPMRIIGKKRIFIGDSVTILNSARMEAVKTWGGGELNGRIKIGDRTSIEQCCHLIAANEVDIGEDCVISAFVYISDCSHRYEPDIDMIRSELIIKHTRIGKHCFIGIGAVIMPGVVVGEYSVVGANAVVTKDVPDYSMVAGTPAKVIKKYDLADKMWKKV